MLGGTSGEFPGYESAALPGEDVFIAKITATGALDWVQQFPGWHRRDAISIDASPTGDIIVGGFFATSPVPPFYYDASSSFLEDAYVVKFRQVPEPTAWPMLSFIAAITLLTNATRAACNT